MGQARERRANHYIHAVSTLADTSLTEDERRVVERLVVLMRDRFAGRLRSVWLYGSRARGERPHPESDIDLVDQAVDELELPRPIVSIKVYDPNWLEGRRLIDSFFIREVDRDKIVLYGEP